MQPLALHIVNSIFLGDYAGSVVESAGEPTLPQARHDLVTVRKRGAGSDLPANT